MRLLLGSILLAVAFAAPVNIDESTSTTEEPTETTTESVETDYDWRKLLRREFFADAAIDDFFAKGLHLSKNVEKAYEWIEKFADEINLKKDKLEQAFKYVVVPEIANVDAEDRSIFPVYNRETYERFHDWAKKWNLDKAAGLRYEDVLVGTEYEGSTTTSEEPPTETATQSIEDGVDKETTPDVDTDEPAEATTTAPVETTTVVSKETIRHEMSEMGIPEKAIEEFIAAGLDSADLNDERVFQRYIEWSTRWEPELEKCIVAKYGPKVKEMGEEVLAETTQIFENTLQAAMLMQILSQERDNMIMGDYKRAMKFLHNLPEFEKELISRAMLHVGRKAAVKYGFKLPGETEEGKKELENNSI